MVRASGNLVAPILLHVIDNAVAAIAIVLAQSG
jgi:membrane protease YdiL (CAAX protease family)